MARMKVKLPAVLGILGAEQPPRYVPVSRIRAAMKSTQFEEQAAAAAGGDAAAARSAGCIRPRPGAMPRCSPVRRPKSPPASPRFLPRKEW